MAKGNDNNILKWLLLLAGVGVGIYAVKKSKDTNEQTTPAQAVPELSEEYTQAAPEAATTQQPPTSASISIDIYQAVDDFVDAINNQVSVSNKIQILNRLQTLQEVEQFKNVCKEVYALTFNDLLTYLDDAELAELTEALLNKNPQMYLFEGYENKPRVTVSVYTSPSVSNSDSNTYTGRSGSSNTTTASTRSNRTGSSSGGRTSTSSSSSTSSLKNLNAEQLKILMM